MILGNIEKRVKRHVVGKTRTFFVSVPPGMERLCVDELSSFGISMAGARLAKGGVEFRGRVHDCYLANLRLRTASRILMRIETFRATNFRELGKRVKGLPWELYLHQDAAYDVHVTSRGSRLFHKGAIADQFKDAVAQRWGLAHSESRGGHDTFHFPQQIFVRVLNDRFTVSIDSSGELLYKRGLKRHGGKAPIRETMAAAILIISGYDGHEPLLDPMCGSGTFSLEGAMMANHIPAGWYREFAFMGWPCFKKTRWKHIRSQAEASITRLKDPVVFASDKDAHVCQVLESVVRENDLSETISVLERDFFDLLPSDIETLTGMKQRGLVAVNPPYGRRLGRKDQGQEMLGEICEKLKKDFKGWRISLVAPKRSLVRRVPFVAKSHDLFHGGLHLTLLTGTIR